MFFLPSGNLTWLRKITIFKWEHPLFLWWFSSSLCNRSLEGKSSWIIGKPSINHPYTIKSHENHHFPVVLLWFSYGIHEGLRLGWQARCRRGRGGGQLFCPGGARLEAEIFPKNHGIHICISCIYIDIYDCIWLYMYICMDFCVYIYIYDYICVWLSMYVYMYMCI